MSEDKCTPPELQMVERETANELPDRSRRLYLNSYQSFKDWCLTRNITKTSENVLFGYLQEKSKTTKASTLWANYSMLKLTLKLKENVDISKYFRLRAYLKRINTTCEPKNFAVFTKQDMAKFLETAPDTTYLVSKVIFVIGVAGACRTDELCNMLRKDIDIRDDIIVVTIPSSTNYSSRKFVITEHLWIQIVKKYFAIRPSPDMPKALICLRNGKPVKQNIGHNVVGQIPRKIAYFLKLGNAGSFTGHAFRRSSATILADSGRNLLSSKRHESWKSSTKRRLAEMSQRSEPMKNINREANLSTSNAKSDDILPELVYFTSPAPSEEPQIRQELIHTSDQNQDNVINIGSGIQMRCSNCTNCTINFFMK